MAQASPCLYQAQAANTRRTHGTTTRQQQARERLELRALSLGADHALAQLAADRWLREVLL
jgi:hypothetical protein